MFKSKDFRLKRNFPCEKCGLKYLSPKTLQNHKSVWHCESCPGVFTSTRLLLEHKRRDHGPSAMETDPLDLAQPEAQSGPGPDGQEEDSNQPTSSQASQVDTLSMDLDLDMDLVFDMDLDSSQPTGGTPGDAQPAQPVDWDPAQPTPQKDPDPDPDPDPGPSLPPIHQEKGELRDRITPNVPPPRTPDPGEGEWAQIDRVGGWRAIISPFGAIDQVPEQHRAVWTWA